MMPPHGRSGRVGACVSSRCEPHQSVLVRWLVRQRPRAGTGLPNDRGRRLGATRVETLTFTSQPRPERYIPPMPQPSRFRRTLFQVMSVQVLALLLLWALQARYAS